VLLFGVYLLFFGAVITICNEGATPVAAASGDPCDIVGSMNEQEVETYDCTPSSSGELVWASDDDGPAARIGDI